VPNQIGHLWEVLTKMHQGEAEEQHEPKKMPLGLLFCPEKRGTGAGQLLLMQLLPLLGQLLSAAGACGCTHRKGAGHMKNQGLLMLEKQREH